MKTSAKIPADIIKAEIARNATDKVYQRGVDYLEQGAVESVIRRGDLLQAEVQGSEYEPYVVSLTITAKGVQNAQCSCPYGEEWDGWCKHIVAVLLFCLENPGDIEERHALKKLLAGLDREQLLALVYDLAADDARIVSTIEEWLTRRNGHGTQRRG